MRILIVKLSSIGDIVHTLPAAAWLRRTCPDARLTWAVDRRAGAILQGSPAIDALIELDPRGWRKSVFSEATRAEARARLAQLRDGSTNGGPAAPVDVAIDFQGLMKSGLVAAASGARRRVGFASSELREPLSRVFLTEQVATGRAGHVIDKNLALARAAIGEGEATGAEYEFPIHVAPEDEAYVDEALRDIGDRFAILNPGGGWPTKCWPAERFGELADWLWSALRMPSVVTTGPGEEGLAERVRQSARSGAARPVRSTIKQLVALSRRAALFVGGDTGPLHIAAASRTPIVGLYGPTSPARNGPFDGRDVTVGRDLWCRAGCHRRSCWHWQCMDIPLADVQRAIERRLEVRG